jgi:hypothetical protein
MKLVMTLIMKLIRKIFSFPKIIYLLILTLIIFLFIINLPSSAITIKDVKFIGEAIIPNGLSFQKTELGGLSGITYDAKNDLFYAISDDRGQKSSARFYTLKIDLGQGKLNKKGVIPVGVTTLLDEKGQTFPPGKTDTEGIAKTNNGTVFISSEGDTAQLVNPFIKEFALASGKEVSSLPIPEKFLPTKDGKRGIRNNLAFESLTITPDQKYLYTATENALLQDGAEAKPKQSTNSRILQYNLQTKQPEKEFLYTTEPFKPLLNLSRFSAGIPDLIALDNHGNFIAIERVFTGIGFYVYLFQVSLDGAEDISRIDSLAGGGVDIKNIKPVKKKLLYDLRFLDVSLDNLEGLTIGPRLPDGSLSLIMVSDNNFQNNLQKNQILAFKLKIEPPIVSFFKRFIPGL